MKLEPSSSEDVEPVKKLQILGNVMIKRKNPCIACVMTSR